MLRDKEKYHVLLRVHEAHAKEHLQSQVKRERERAEAQETMEKLQKEEGLCRLLVNKMNGERLEHAVIKAKMARELKESREEEKALRTALQLAKAKSTEQETKIDWLREEAKLAIQRFKESPEFQKEIPLLKKEAYNARVDSNFLTLRYYKAVDIEKFVERMADPELVASAPEEEFPMQWAELDAQEEEDEEDEEGGEETPLEILIARPLPPVGTSKTVPESPVPDAPTPEAPTLETPAPKSTVPDTPAS